MPRLFLILATANVIGLLATGCAPVLLSPPHLVAAWPAAGVTLPVEPTTFDLMFNHALSPEASWAAAWRDEDGMPISAASQVELSNPRQLSLILKEPVAGEYHLHWHAVAARTAAAVDGEQTFSLQDESSAPPRLELSRVAAETGEKVEVTGKGFGERCPVRLTIGDDEQPLSTIETDAQGSFAVEARVPENVPFGEQPVSATDMCGAAATAALEVRWGGWPPLVAFDVGQPGSAPGEVTFSVTLRNRSDYVLERVRVVLPDPQGASFVSADPAPKRKDQTITWEVPTLDRGVRGPFRVTYRVAGAVSSHVWIEFRHRRPHSCSGDDCLPAFVSETTSESTPVAARD